MTRNEVILDNLNMANQIASMYAMQFPPSRDDIMSAAYYGLVRAAQKKKPTASYIALRIRGEIVDSLRKSHALTRSDRAFLADYLTQEGTLDERAIAMGLAPEYVFKRLACMAYATTPIHIDENIPSRQESQLNEILEVCLKYLPRNVHRIFVLRYRDQLSLPEISRQTGWSTRWVGQHLRNALAVLQSNKAELADILF